MADISTLLGLKQEDKKTTVIVFIKDHNYLFLQAIKGDVYERIDLGGFLKNSIPSNFNSK